MTYLFRNKDFYYYNRRVPELYREVDTRDRIRISLKTDSRSIAHKKAIILNEQIEAYWNSLIADGGSYEEKRFRQVVKVARQMGVTYKPVSEVAQLPLQELIERLLAAKDATPIQVEAVLGGREPSKLLLRDAWERYLQFTKDRRIKKTPLQVRKWINPRKKAIENLISVTEHKEITSYTREDLNILRDWWIERVHKGMRAASANKDFAHLQNFFECVSDNLQLNIKTDVLFKKVTLRTKTVQSRLPFTAEQAINILESSRLGNMQDNLKWVIWALSETGMRPTEVAGLLPEDIVLNAEIPYVRVVARDDRDLKTDHSAREIPLIGYSLEGFKNIPNGIAEYRYKTDNLTNAVNKFLRENKLFPSEQHSLYSFRHSFQDRILAANAPDRVQADLMGHMFKRPKYGDGASLAQKLEWLKKAELSAST